MLSFIADSRSGSNGSGCNTCCCERISARQGETNAVLVNYAGWAAFIAGQGLSNETAFDISDCRNCNGSKPEFAKNIILSVNENETLQVDLSDSIVNSGAGSYSYSLLSLFGFKHGFASAHLNSSGNFVYSPQPNFRGYDRAFFKVINEFGDEEIHEIVIKVNPVGSDLPQPEFTPAVSVDDSRVNVDRIGMTVTFPLAVAPNAKVGNIYRVTLKAVALDCDCNPFEHIMCFDVTIGKC